MHHTYVIPAALPLIIRDAPLDPEAIRATESEHDIAELQDLIRLILGDDTPVAKAVKEYGFNLFRILYTKSDIKDILKVSDEEATKILAVIHFGRKLFAPAVGSFPYARGIQDIELLYRPMAYLPEEQLRVLLVNNRYQIVHEQIVHSSASGILEVSPVAVLHPAVKRDIRAIILVHNHPSGVCAPSQEDFDFSRKILQAAELLHITVLDHVIVAQDGAVSALPGTSGLKGSE